jgi:hemerythrin-like domain-containing protein
MPKTQKTAPDALDLLREDHAKVKKAFKEFEKMEKEDVELLKEFVATVCEDLKAHTMIEEEIFYPAVRAKIDDDDLMNEALIEHQSAKDLIAQLESLQPGDPAYVPSFTVLGEYVNHHVTEEENEMFPEVKKLDLDLEALGQQMQERKDELVGEEA